MDPSHHARVMTEYLADGAKHVCRLAFGFGNLLLIWVYLVVRNPSTSEELPFTPEQGLALLVLAVVAIGGSLLVGAYLSLAMGVDVFGLNRLTGYPRGKPFGGLAAGEEVRLRYRWIRGSLGRGASLGFKLLLTDRRILAGSSLSSWYLLEIPLASVRLVTREKPRWGPEAVRFHLTGSEPASWVLTLGGASERARLIEELSHFGLSPVKSTT